MTPHIAICTPSWEIVHASFMRCVIGIIVCNPTIKFSFINNHCAVIAEGRNQSVKNMLSVPSHTHLLFLDADMEVPREVPVKLLSYDKDIVGCTYSMRYPPFKKLEEPEGFMVFGQDIQTMKHMPMGCMLIKRRVFEMMSPPYFDYGHQGFEIKGEDYWFCDRARKLGFEVWCDINLSLTVGHVGQQAFYIQPE